MEGGRPGSGFEVAVSVARHAAHTDYLAHSSQVCFLLACLHGGSCTQDLHAASQRARMASRQRAAGRISFRKCARSRILDRLQARANAIGSTPSAIARKAGQSHPREAGQIIHMGWCSCQLFFLADPVAALFLAALFLAALFLAAIISPPNNSY